MSRKTRSARGDMVDFDLLAIKQQLASTPAPVTVDNRRRFIDEKENSRSRENFIVKPEPSSPKPVETRNADLDDSNPLALAAAAAKASAAAKNLKEK